MSVTKVLIANRGEIAVRVIRAAKDAGLLSVAVYVPEEVDSLYVSLADEAFALPGESLAENFLNAEVLIDVAKRAGADTVHPGYGFLSENANFARAVVDAGLTWIGPDAETIELLGDKARARELAAEVGAPLVPGSAGPVKDAAEVTEFANRFGLPLIIKAVAGGGGRGMRVVRDLAEIDEAFEAAAREAHAAFGRSDCLVERFLEQPRHLEVQILGDTHGRIEAIGSRDCSLQRRNQKLVEESPAPFLPDATRKALHAAAVDICKAVGYVSAGTVEFLLGEDGILAFLEVNTRIQVEHPVTELTSGIDLVQQQFLIAAGKAMTVPADIPVHGHAIEFRINAEDPALGFLPSPGTIETFDAPSGPGVRFDSGVRAGDVVSGRFDSLLAKLIVWGEDREQAVARATRALAEFNVSGVATVIPFAQAVLERSDFVAADGIFRVHTRWIEQQEDLVLEPASPSRSTGQTEMTRFSVEVNGQLMRIGLTPETLSRMAMRPAMGNAESTLSEAAPGNGQNSVEPSEDQVIAPFAGSITKWAAAEGSSVAQGDLVAVLEAMKMEVPVHAPVSGKLVPELAIGSEVRAGQRIGRVIES